MRRILLGVALLSFTSFVSYAQQTPCERVADVKMTSAYSMLALRKTAVEAELTEILSSYTSDFPVARSRQMELNTLEQEMKRMAKTAGANLPKLNSSYGTLILQRVKLETEMQDLLLGYTSNHPAVKLKKVELNLLEHEIAKMMR
jgi:uncharacterized protein involved in exopolysaccharide biosynthesis